MAPRTVMSTSQAPLAPASVVPGSPESPPLGAPQAGRLRQAEESWPSAPAAAASDGSLLPLAAGERGVRAADGDRARVITCGLWLARRRLVAAVLGQDGRRIIRAALTDEARFGLLEYLTATQAEITVTEALARVDLMPVQAARRGLLVWTAGDALVAALLGAAAIRDPARAAALLARLPAIPLMRSSIRRLVAPDRRQLPLL